MTTTCEYCREHNITLPAWARTEEERATARGRIIDARGNAVMIERDTTAEVVSAMTEANRQRKLAWERTLLGEPTPHAGLAVT